IERIMSEGQIGATFNALDRLMPGLGGIARQSAAPGLVAALGQRAVLEGKPAVAFPVRFADGAVFLGPFQVGVVPPLFCAPERHRAPKRLSTKAGGRGSPKALADAE